MEPGCKRRKKDQNSEEIKDGKRQFKSKKGLPIHVNIRCRPDRVGSRNTHPKNPPKKNRKNNGILYDDE